MEVPTISIDFGALAGLIVTAFLDAVRELVAPLPLDFTSWLQSSVQEVQNALADYNFLTNVPTRWTTEHPDVLALWREGLLAQASLTALVLVIQGYRIMSGRADLWDVLFRTGFFVLAAQAAVWGIHSASVVVNALSNWIGFASFQPDVGPSLVMAVLLIIAAVFGVLAWIKGAVGVVFVAFLIVVAPYILTLAALPMFEGLSKWWVEELTTWLLRPFFVAIVLRLGMGMGTLMPGPVEVLMAIVCFWLAWTMDSRIRRFSVGAWGSVGQMGLLAKGARATSGAFGGLGHAAPVAAGAAGVAAVAATAALPSE